MLCRRWTNKIRKSYVLWALDGEKTLQYATLLLDLGMGPVAFISINKEKPWYVGARIGNALIMVDHLKRVPTLSWGNLGKELVRGISGQT